MDGWSAVAQISLSSCVLLIFYLHRSCGLEQNSKMVLQSLQRQMRYIPVTEKDVLGYTGHLHAFKLYIFVGVVRHCHSASYCPFISFILSPNLSKIYQIMCLSTKKTNLL